METHTTDAKNIARFEASGLKSSTATRNRPLPATPAPQIPLDFEVEQIISNDITDTCNISTHVEMKVSPPKPANSKAILGDISQNDQNQDVPQASSHARGRQPRTTGPFQMESLHHSFQVASHLSGDTTRLLNPIIPTARPDIPEDPSSLKTTSVLRAKKRKRTFHYLPCGFAPIINFDLEKYLLAAGLCPEAEAYLRAALAAPSRHLSGFVSHTILYPSVRFGRSLKLESRNLEYPFCLTTAYRPDVLCVLEQPPVTHIVLPGRNGWLKYTPDLLVITATGIEVWETKHKTKLAGECLQHPIRYQEENGVYKSAPVDNFFKNWGFKYAIVTEEVLHPGFCQAVNFLHGYIQGYPQNPITKQEREEFIGYVRKHSGIRLGEIPTDSPTRRTELALYFLAQAVVFTSLSEVDFKQPNAIRLYATAQDELAFHQYLDHARPRPANLEDLGYRLKTGALIEIGDTDYKVVRLTMKLAELQMESGETIPLSHKALLDLKPRIGRVYGAEKTFDNLYQTSSMEHRLTYAARKQAIKPYLPGSAHDGAQPKTRTVRRWLNNYLRAERKGLCGDTAIFPGFHDCGRCRSEMVPAIETELKSLISRHYLNPKACSIQWVWLQLLGTFGRERLLCKRSIERRIAEMDPHKKAWRRGGKRFALKHQPVFGDSDILGSPNGQRSFQRAHIDSSPIDLRAEESLFLAKMVDGFGQRILAEVVTAEAPSEFTIRELLLECVRRHGTLPAEISCDFGSEHRTVWIQESLMLLGIIIDIRPKSDPRKGSPAENKFSKIVKELFNNMEGNTKLMKRARLVTKAVDPTQFAVWTTTDIRALVREYCELCNDLERIGVPSPNAIAEASIEKYGPPPCPMPKVEELEMLLLPFAKGGTRTVSARGTIRCRNRTYGIKGALNELRRFAGRALKVRWDPKDAAHVYIFSEKPVRSFRLECVNLTGPSEDIMESAAAIDRDSVNPSNTSPNPTPEDRRAAFVVKTVKKESELKAQKALRKKHASVRQAPASEDATIPTINVE